MPPRKNTTAPAAGQTTEVTKSTSTADVSMISNATTTEPTSPKTKKSKQSQSDDMTIDDLLLPRSLISRISRGVLPPNTSIQKDAILALTKSATVFISHLAAEANDLTDRKTVQSQDVLKAIKEIEMDGVMGLGVVGQDGRTGGRLEREIDLFEEMVRGKRRGYREKVKKSRESGVSKPEDETTLMTINGDAEEEDRGHQSKRARRDNEDDESHEAIMEGIATGSTEAHPNDKNLRKSDGSGINDGQDDEGDQTETDPEMADANEEDEDEEEEDEEDEDEDEEDDEVLQDDDLLEGKTSRTKLHDKDHRLIAPDGTVHVESDEEGNKQDDSD